MRLLLPLLFGILVVVPPQLFVEMSGKGELHMTYWQFYQIFFDLDNPAFDNYKPGVLPHIDVNHLWYLRELWTFSLIILCLSPLLNSRIVQSRVEWFAGKTGYSGLYFLPMIVLTIVELALPDDRGASGFTFLLFGYLIGWNATLWEQIKHYRQRFLSIALISYIAILLAYFIVWLNPELKALWWAKWLALIAIFNGWSALLALLGYSATYLNKPSAKLSYFNDAVLPYYIVHQTYIIVLAYLLVPLQLGPVLEPLLIILGTIGGCLLSYEVIRRITILRPLFGLKWEAKKSIAVTAVPTVWYRIGNALAYVLLLPLALKLIVF